MDFLVPNAGQPQGRQDPTRPSPARPFLEPLPLARAPAEALAALSRPSRECFDASWTALLQTLLGWGRAAGADFVEFFLERGNQIGCLAEDDAITSVSPSLAVGAGVRVFRGAADAFVSTNDISSSGLRVALDKALAIVGLSFPSPAFHAPEVNLEPLRDYGALRQKNRWLQECSSVSEMTGLVLDANARLKPQVRHAQSLRSQYTRHWQEVLVAASDGVFARDVRLNQVMGSYVLCADGGYRASVQLRLGSTGNPDFLRGYDGTTCAAELAESAGKMLYADYVESGNYPVVMANQFGGVIFHEACGHLLETTSIVRKTTPFADCKGTLIASESVTAWDEGVTPHAFGSVDMDDEGMPVQRTLLIEKGVLRNFLADRQGSARTGHPRTGSGRRQDHTFAAASRMRNTYIGAGEHSREDLFAAIDRGIYCKRMGGGSVGPTGQFNFSVNEAYLIENGKITRPLKGATLIGEAREILLRISMCSSDLELAPGFCGSVSGSIYTTVGQPHLKVDSITVGGR